MKWSNVLKLTGVVLLVVSFALMMFPLQVFDDMKFLPLTKEIKQGLDLQGGVHVLLEAQGTPESPVTDDAISRVITILENRVNQFGVSEPVVQRQGRDRIIVELAGINDPDAAVDDLIQTAYLEFKTENGETVLTGSDLKDATEGKTGEMVQVNLTFTPTGAKKFADITTANVKKHLGIYLDGKMLQNPVIDEPITQGQARITGYASLDEAHTMAVLLRSGALPVKVEVLEKRTVGPTLGQDSLDKSVKAGMIGLALIILFMAAYYRTPGMVANVALAIYVLLVLMAYAALKVTMTLPGVAGFILSLGIAIDANVIIFERLKEELRAGKTLRSAIDAGFKRAFVAIVDANVTTLIAAFVLYYFGMSMVKGFALTLGIGIIASMFTAIVITKRLLHLVAGAKKVKNLKWYGA
ncbi:MAG TPA: protein translocase subunit SecD [Clostridia bacterium]|nr:protein translocase subunit SecD [Clostridia bacterium]